ncbi:Sister chromatid cohesion protein Dcc1 like protein [Aduncisulcus paluster]|uniref:Sister chromatid cohesion protein Dcc1 like protein n=1 Tax=Aduncisulcus paluster TaxID=2918883 RepID=A0ABQ5K4I8_9EUKA|nr:Sister chromatid cohesion protein Dcc1 like protein [Aduncisulcus paluster]
MKRLVFDKSFSVNNIVLELTDDIYSSVISGQSSIIAKDDGSASLITEKESYDMTKVESTNTNLIATNTTKRDLKQLESLILSYGPRECGSFDPIEYKKGDTVIEGAFSSILTVNKRTPDCRKVSKLLHPDKSSSIRDRHTFPFHMYKRWTDDSVYIKNITIDELKDTAKASLPETIVLLLHMGAFPMHNVINGLQPMRVFAKQYEKKIKAKSLADRMKPMKQSLSATESGGFGGHTDVRSSDLSLPSTAPGTFPAMSVSSQSSTSLSSCSNDDRDPDTQEQIDGQSTGQPTASPSASPLVRQSLLAPADSQEMDKPGQRLTHRHPHLHTGSTVEFGTMDYTHWVKTICDCICTFIRDHGFSQEESLSPEIPKVETVHKKQHSQAKTGLSLFLEAHRGKSKDSSHGIDKSMYKKKTKDEEEKKEEEREEGGREEEERRGSDRKSSPKICIYLNDCVEYVVSTLCFADKRSTGNEGKAGVIAVLRWYIALYLCDSIWRAGESSTEKRKRDALLSANNGKGGKISSMARKEGAKGTNKGRNRREEESSSEESSSDTDADSRGDTQSASAKTNSMLGPTSFNSFRISSNSRFSAVSSSRSSSSSFSSSSSYPIPPPSVSLILFCEELKEVHESISPDVLCKEDGCYPCLSVAMIMCLLLRKVDVLTDKNIVVRVCGERMRKELFTYELEKLKKKQLDEIKKQRERDEAEAEALEKRKRLLHKHHEEEESNDNDDDGGDIVTSFGAQSTSPRKDRNKVGAGGSFAGTGGSFAAIGKSYSKRGHPQSDISNPISLSYGHNYTLSSHEMSLQACFGQTPKVVDGTGETEEQFLLSQKSEFINHHFKLFDLRQITQNIRISIASTFPGLGRLFTIPSVGKYKQFCALPSCNLSGLIHSKLVAVKPPCPIDPDRGFLMVDPFLLPSNATPSVISEHLNLIKSRWTMDELNWLLKYQVPSSFKPHSLLMVEDTVAVSSDEERTSSAIYSASKKKEKREEKLKVFVPKGRGFISIPESVSVAITGLTEQTLQKCIIPVDGEEVYATRGKWFE